MAILITLAALLLPAPAGPPPPPGPFLSPMGEPFRSADPIATWFGGADRDGDGAVSPAELRSDAARFFESLDSDGNGEIGPAEIARYENEVAPEVQTGLQMRGAGVGDWRDPNRRHRRVPLYEEGIEGAGRYAFLNIPEPVIAADEDMNRGVSREEFVHAASHRFELLDSDRDGRLLRSELPPLPQPSLRRRARHRDREYRAPGGPARQPTEFR